MSSKHALLLKDTIWIVPPATLLAYQYSRFGYTPVIDQTVWIIDDYNEGYFFGKSYMAILNPPHPISRIESKLIGSITEEGAVYMTFISSDSSSSTNVVEGIGTFSKEHGNYQFTMQMNSGSRQNGISHWSNMIHITKESPYFEDLPGVHQSLPQFLKGFNG